MSATQPAAAGAIDVVEMTIEKGQAGFAGGAFTSLRNPGQRQLGQTDRPQGRT
jgi:hypothetical protein